jgi:catechol 2,3-dioxygenase-like lactoylglutathione lyase family enzyme
MVADPMITGIDHTLAVTHDLEATAGLYRRLGFTLTPRGRHIGWGTANYCVMFADNYLELLGIVDPGQCVNGLDDHLADRGAGIAGAAFATFDAAAVHAVFKRQGMDLRHADLARLLELADGNVTLRFRLTHAKPGATPGLSCFVCQHLTPALLRQPHWLNHENGSVGVEGMTILHDDPAALEAAYTHYMQALGLPLDRVWRGQGRLDLPVGGSGAGFGQNAGTTQQFLRFLTPMRAARRYPGLATHWLNRPGPLVITLAVNSLDATRAYMQAQDIRVMPVPGDRVVVDPVITDGTIFEFAEWAY